MQRAVDPLTDDLSTLVLAFDLPRGVEPIERESVFKFDAGPSSGGRHLSVALVRVDAGDATSGLPPPGKQRVYYLFGFTESDKSALRDAQTWARGQGIIPTIALAPRFCRVTPIDPATVSVAVMAVLPGQPRLAPLFERQVLADALQAAGGGYPDCI